MIGQQIDLVAGDFYATAWRRSNRDNISTIDEAFADCALPTPPGPCTVVGDPVRFQTTGLTSVDSFRPGSSYLGSVHARRLFRSSQNPRSASKRSKLPS